MTEEVKMSFFKEVELKIESNNAKHRTNEITNKELIVRRGEPFTVFLKLTESFHADRHPLTVVALTGVQPCEERGTISYFGIPDNVQRSTSAKAVWKIKLKKESYPKKGILHLAITPAADTPIGEFILTIKYKDEETLLAIATVLFNPWCADDSVFLPLEEERQEYVMNEQGIIYRGSAMYHFPLSWDFGQFEDDMVRICMKILDRSVKHIEDPAADRGDRCDPIYVSRVVSAMINSTDDSGVLEGSWGSSFEGGFSPSHWNGSHAILKGWFNRDCHPVKYGQCWVFAGVMCSVMRLLGIPCRVVTNFESAHDTNKNLIIDTYHADYGVAEKDSPDSVWNFHVWVEGWMKRPDLAENGKYDGWQVVDPTPQEASNGLYCCGPASVKAIRNGFVDLKYDAPFVYAEVNADCIDWLVKADGSKKQIFSDTKRVGAALVTKCVGSNKKKYITKKYKFKEGSKKERAAFKYAVLELEEGDEVEEDSEDDDTSGGTDEETPDVIIPPSPLTMRFEEVAKPKNGEDVNLRLVLHSESSFARPLSIAISVQVMRHNGTPAVNLQKDVKEETLQPGKDLTIPILIPFLAYHKPMLEGESMKVSAMVTDLKEPGNVYLAEDDIVLIEPPIIIQVDSSEVKFHKNVKVAVIFKNPANEILTDCKLTLSGSGLLRDETITKLPDLPPKCQFRIGVHFIPYRKGKKTLLVDLDCKTFRDIKGTCTVNVTD
ncbi:protein-glutamine gamma-glutamyltransferase E-like [Solea senegalensis]|uniref:protein-glutamine gamma-glutamyltransferase n=1 Tax=Solea senegalensis TaxID=28829 RepID=A0AAV6QQQ2_SOLSE|nr:protein-glutamine gamma-glutamyltransferase E [Solea senegalensis]KAG7495423.1 protein-glutamine gamma-glutamyltransferase E-like [Solea senegalensis]